MPDPQFMVSGRHKNGPHALIKRGGLLNIGRVIGSGLVLGDVFAHRETIQRTFLGFATANGVHRTLL